MFNKYSHKKLFNYDSSNNEFISLKDYQSKNGSKIIVRGMFTYEGKKGERAAIVTDGYNVNVPEHINADVKSIMSAPDEVAAVNAGKCGFEITTYEDNKYGNGICYSGNFYDIE